MPDSETTDLVSEVSQEAGDLFDRKTSDQQDRLAMNAVRKLSTMYRPHRTDTEHKTIAEHAIAGMDRSAKRETHQRARVDQSLRATLTPQELSVQQRIGPANAGIMQAHYAAFYDRQDPIGQILCTTKALLPGIKKEHAQETSRQRQERMLETVINMSDEGRKTCFVDNMMRHHTDVPECVRNGRF